MRIRGVEAWIVSCHTPLPVLRERNFPKKEEPVVLGLSIAENGRDKGDSTEEVPVQKVKTAIRGLSKKAYGVLSHVPSCRAIYARSRNPASCHTKLSLQTRVGPYMREIARPRYGPIVWMCSISSLDIGPDLCHFAVAYAPHIDPTYIPTRAIMIVPEKDPAGAASLDTRKGFFGFEDRIGGGTE